MWLLLLTSVAALFPGAALPVGVGWKHVSAFDIFFAAAVLDAARTRAFTRPDRPLLLAGGVFCAMAWLSLARAYSPPGLRMATVTTYSVLVLLVIAHVRIDMAQTRRVILWAIGIATSIAWLTVIAEVTLGGSFPDNHSGALPADLPRLGGFTGGSVLALFLAMAAPFARRGALAQAAIFISSYATLARAMAGVGVATLLSSRRGELGTPRSGLLVNGMAALAIMAGLFAYTFAIIDQPINPTSFASRLEAGPYRVLNAAALRMVADAPILGQGLSGFNRRFSDFTSEEEQRQVGGDLTPLWDPHSAILGLASEQGLAALAAFAWLMVEIYRRLMRCEDPDHRGRAVASLFGLLVGGLVVDWISLKGLWLWMGLLVASSRPSLNSRAREDEPARPSGSRSGWASS